MTDSLTQDHTGVPVRVMPATIDIAVPMGQSLMQAARALGIRWQNACNGQAQCGLCVIEVLEGDLSTMAPATREAQMLGRMSQRPKQGGVLRLACQIKPTAPITVHKLGVRAPAGAIPQE